MTGNIDLAATILDASLGRPNHGNGTSLLKHYGNNNNPKQDRIIPLINVWGPKQVFSLGFVKGDWKYIYWPYTGDGMKATAEMYNLKEDPLELHNRINDKSIQGIRLQLERDYTDLVQAWTQQSIDRPHYKHAATFFTRQER